jgi:hypothetical protein
VTDIVTNIDTEALGVEVKDIVARLEKVAEAFSGAEKALKEFELESAHSTVGLAGARLHQSLALRGLLAERSQLELKVVERIHIDGALQAAGRMVVLHAEEYAAAVTAFERLRAAVPPDVVVAKPEAEAP